MKIRELITEEAYVSHDVVNALRKKGYKRLGSGAEAEAWLEPGTGLILKIIGTSTNSFKNPGMMTGVHSTFKAFVNFCKANPNNPFLPQFSGWEKFTFDGNTYLQVRMERLFPMKRAGWGDALEEIADTVEAEVSGSPFALSRKETIDGILNNPNNGIKYKELFTHLGRDGFNLLWNTIEKLLRQMPRGVKFDLHSNNFMLGSDGQIVISDPYYSGSDFYGMDSN